MNRGAVGPSCDKIRCSSLFHIATLWPSMKLPRQQRTDEEQRVNELIRRLLQVPQLLRLNRAPFTFQTLSSTYSRAMGGSFSRKCRIHNCPENIILNVLHDPGNCLVKEITILPDGYKDISFQTVDNKYNRDRSKKICILRQGQGQGQGQYEKEIIEAYHIRDCKMLKLTLIDDAEKENMKKVHVDRIKGNFLRRLGISWMVKDLVDLIGKLKKSENPMENGVVSSTPVDMLNDTL